MSDIRLIGDLLLARLVWVAGLAVTELLIKPFLIRKYNRLDAKLNDVLPNLSDKP